MTLLLRPESIPLGDSTGPARLGHLLGSNRSLGGRKHRVELMRYRRLQSLSIAMLAALITTCAVFAPMYDRATQQALVDVRLGHVPEQVRGLGLVAAPALGNNFSGATSSASTMG